MTIPEVLDQVLATLRVATTLEEAVDRVTWLRDQAAAVTENEALGAYPEDPLAVRIRDAGSLSK